MVSDPLFAAQDDYEIEMGHKPSFNSQALPRTDETA
jgi:hypothetical protein